MHHFSSAFRTLVFGLFCSPLLVWGQLPPLQPEQDCINALPVCQSTYFQPNSYQGPGAINNEINGALSCLAGETNDVWYIFTVQTSGLLYFNITPVTLSNDYDWAVYNLTNNPCSDISSNPAMEVSCNFSGQSGITGANTPGAPNSQGAGGTPNNAPLPVVAGETYVLNVSNWSTSTAGYTLDFGNSTAVIFDNIPPEIDDMTADCSGNISFSFTENVVCATVDPTDFTIVDTFGVNYPVTAVSGANCAIGGDFESDFDITLSSPIGTGVYVLTIVDTVLDNCGNVAVINFTDTIDLVLPALNAGAFEDTICEGESTMIGTLAQAGFTYTWNPGSLVGDSVSVSPLSTTTYTVVASAPNGCTFSGAVEVTVTPTPSAIFTALPNQVCPDVPVTLTYVGGAPGGSDFDWDFDGGTILSGSGAGPYDISWSTAGAISPNLRVTYLGCESAIVTVPGTIFPIPSADFVGSDSVCLTSTGVFSYSGTAPLTANYNWDFDGGLVLNGAGQGPYQVEWPTPGPKDICLIVDENGCISEQICKTVRIDPLPVISIAEPEDQCLKGNSVSFLYDGPSLVQTYLWDFGENGATSSLEAPSFSYSTFGIKPVTLTITDERGCTTSGSYEVEIFPSVDADFSFSESCFGRSSLFLDESTVQVGHPVVAWDWVFGDGSEESGFSATEHSYDSYGTYEVSLFVETIDGCKDTLTQTVPVFDQPIASYTFSSQCDDVPIPFSNTSSFNNPNVTYEWDFGDASVFSDDDSPLHLYETHGLYPVSLTVTTDEGCSDIFVADVAVHPLPVAAFEADTACAQTFTSFSNETTVDAPGEMFRWRWRFGDGQGGNNMSPTYPYGLPGRYTVQLWTQTRDGCLDSTTQTVTVYANPRVSFKKEAACALDTVFLTNTSTIVDSITGDSIQGWVWRFGDGNSAGSLPVAAYPYRESGIFDVELEVTSDKGCVTAWSEPVEVYPIPAVPELRQDTVCFGDQAFLQALSGRSLDQVHWYEDIDLFEPFQTAYSYATPPVVYTQVYYVEAESEYGCLSGRVPAVAEIYTPGQGQITVSDSILDIPESTVQFGLAETFRVVEQEWFFGDGQSARTANPVHTYAFPGKFEVQAILRNAQGCEERLSRVIEVKQLIVAHIPSGFTPNGDGVNDLFYMQAQSVDQLDFQVFNRWGQAVFTSKQLDFKWDGKDLKGQDLAEGVYVYRLHGIDIQGKAFDQQGTISLVR